MTDPFDGNFPSGAVKNEVILKPFAPVKKEMLNVDELSPQTTEQLDKMNWKSEVEENHEPVLDSEDIDDDVPYLSGKKPFFDVTLAQSHVHPGNQLNLPADIVRQHFPCSTHVPVVLRHDRKEWNMSYLGNNKHPRFTNNWKQFVTDNDLKEDDALVFELIECNKAKIISKVHILRCELPRELQLILDNCGSSENPIAID